MKDKKKKKKKKKPQEVQVVQYQKPDIYQLVDHSDLEELSGHGGGHGGFHHGGLMHHMGGLHKKKHGRSIGGLFGRFEASAILFGFGTLK